MRESHIPPIPEGFTDIAAWDAIHWRFSSSVGRLSFLDRVVMEWQKDNQERVLAAIYAKGNDTEITSPV